MSNRVWISSIQFSDSSTVHFDKNDIVIIVGPNNAGKSATLREASQMLRQKSQKGKVIQNIEIKISEDEDIKDYLSKISIKQYQGDPEPRYYGYGYNIYGGSISSYWINAEKSGIGELYPVFANFLTTEQRLQAANPPNSIRLTTEAIQHPIHYLQRDDKEELRFSNYFLQAFGMDLVVHRNAGSIVPLYIGTRPTPMLGDDRVSIDYLKEIEKLDLLNEQGDGMRSFVGVLLSAFISNHSILFIDEPEAFLHPPQARLLGKMLAKDFPVGRQLFLSTHSEDFLKGILDSNAENVKVIRIKRIQNVNNVCTLNTEDIHAIWDDSLLRHSNILNGLFHSKVIICESDSDCRFFSAILHSIYIGTTSIAPDILFVHCGGKHRIPTAIKALKRVGVDVRVVTDFDVLNDENPIKYIVEDLEGEWSRFESDWHLIKYEIEHKRPELLTEELQKEIFKVFQDTQDRIFPKENIKKIENVLKKASAWNEAKEVGKAYIPAGNATQAFEQLNKGLKSIGFFILEIGELECFVRSIGNHGPKWVSEVLSRDLTTDPELEYARSFVEMIIQ